MLELGPKITTQSEELRQKSLEAETTKTAIEAHSGLLSW
jgi:hypothetical protein